MAGDELWILQSRPISTLGATLQAEADSIAHERAQEEAREVLEDRLARGSRVG